MKLKSILGEAASGAADKLAALLGDDPVVRKLIDWATGDHQTTNPSDRHTGAVCRRELVAGARLVANPWKADVLPADLYGLEVLDYGTQLMLALPANRDVLELVAAGRFAGTPKAHLVRGLAFGYDPSGVLDYYNRTAPRESWSKLLRSLGIRISSEYGTGGYASVADATSGNVVVEPGDRLPVEQNLDKLGKLAWTTRWCPECQSEILVRGKYPHEELPTRCPHEPAHTPEVEPATQRHWFYYHFEPHNAAGL